MNAVQEDKGDISVKEVHEDDDELHARCMLVESENEQWQEVTSKKKLAYESLLSVEKQFLCISEESQRSGHQGHNGYRSCRARHASRGVPESETGSHEHNKEICCSKWRKDRTLG